MKRSRQAYLIAILLTGAAFLLRLAINPLLDGYPSYGLFLVAVLFSSWFGGVRPGLLSLVLSLLLSVVFFFEPSIHFSLNEEPDIASLVVFTTVASGLMYLLYRVRGLNEELLVSNARLKAAERAAGFGVWDWCVAENEVYWSPEYMAVFGLDPTTRPSIQTWLGRVVPEDREAVAQAVRSAVESKSKVEIEFRIERNGEARWIRVIGGATADGPLRITGIAIDITTRKALELELQRSNDELQRFAHAVSHDLKEPLRMIGSYTELLKRRYPPSQEVEQFISFILDGVRRMSALIEGLLQYSTVDYRAGRNFSSVDCNVLVTAALQHLKPSSPGLKSILVFCGAEIRAKKEMTVRRYNTPAGYSDSSYPHFFPS